MIGLAFEATLVAAALAAGLRARHGAQPVAAPPREAPRRAAWTVAAALAAIAVYCAADPLSAWFCHGMSVHLEQAELALQEGSRWPLRGPPAGGMLHLGPLYYYLLMPGVAAGRGPEWMILLAGLAFAATVALLVAGADRLFGFPAGALAGPLFALLAGPECRHDPRHAPLAAPLVALALIFAERFRRTPSRGGWIGLSLAFWLGLQFHMSVAVLLPVIAYLAPRRAAALGCLARLAAFAALGAALNAPLLYDYWSMGLPAQASSLINWGAATGMTRLLSPWPVFAIGALATLAARMTLKGTAGGLCWVSLLLALAYLPGLSALEPRYLFPWWTATALTLGAAGAALWRLPGGAARGSAPALALTCATLLLAGYRSIPAPPTGAETFRGLQSLLDSLPPQARAGSKLSLHGPLAPQAASALEYPWRQRWGRRTDASGPQPAAVLFSAPAALRALPRGCLDLEAARLLPQGGGEAGPLPLPLRTLSSALAAPQEERAATLYWLGDQIRAGRTRWIVTVPVAKGCGAAARPAPRFEVLLAGAAGPPAPLPGSRMVESDSIDLAGGGEARRAVFELDRISAAAGFLVELREPPRLLDLYEIGAQGGP